MTKTASGATWRLNSAPDGIRYSQFPRGNIPVVSTGYSTSFSANENPISESGNWRRPGSSVFNNDMLTSGGRVFGGSGASSTNDAVAVLTGTNYLGNTQIATVTLYNASAISGIEMELHFNVVDTSTTIKLYEIDIVSNGGSGDFLNIVKWNGAQGDIYIFHGADIVQGSGTATGGVWANGDILEGSVTGTSPRLITLKQNGTIILQVQDTGANSGSAVYTTGNPGIGGDNGGASNQTFGFADYTVTTA